MVETLYDISVTNLDIENNISGYTQERCRPVFCDKFSAIEKKVVHRTYI